MDDGGPFHPTDSDNFGPKYSGPGASLRDVFAIAALQSLSSAIQDESITTLEDRAADTARACYTIADAMLKARHG